MISLEDKQYTLVIIAEAVESGARKFMACDTLEISTRTLQRWEQDCVADRRKGAPKRVARKLSSAEEAELLDIACSSRFKDLNPHEIVPILAEEGRYIASESSFYRYLREHGLIHHRGNGKPRSSNVKPPELATTGPNQVWSWDITWLKSDIDGIFYYCYMIKDIWKKNIVGWEIHNYESVDIASEMFKKLKSKCNLRGVRLHSDNGNPMKGSTMIMTLYSLGVVPSYNRPRVSNDNPYIESLFSTLKYSAGYPGHFKSLKHTREWMAEFVNWYNTEHRHSAIGFITPEQRGTEKEFEIFSKRNEVIEKARELNPIRWGKKVRQWESKAEIVLNPDKKEKVA